MDQNKIIHRKNVKFRIRPRLNFQDRVGLEFYMDGLELFYENFGGFFWKFDQEHCQFVVNDKNELASFDFQNHLIKIISWLYKKGYTVTGSFYYRNVDHINYIHVKKSVIKNFIIIDPSDSFELENMSEIESKIINYIKKFEIDKHSLSKYFKKKISKMTTKNIIDIFAYACLLLTYAVLLWRKI